MIRFGVAFIGTRRNNECTRRKNGNHNIFNELNRKVNESREIKCSNIKKYFSTRRKIINSENKLMNGKKKTKKTMRTNFDLFNISSNLNRLIIEKELTGEEKFNLVTDKIESRILIMPNVDQNFFHAT